MLPSRAGESTRTAGGLLSGGVQCFQCRKPSGEIFQFNRLDCKLQHRVRCAQLDRWHAMRHELLLISAYRLAQLESTARHNAPGLLQGRCGIVARTRDAV